MINFIQCNASCRMNNSNKYMQLYLESRKSANLTGASWSHSANTLSKALNWSTVTWPLWSFLAGVNASLSLKVIRVFQWRYNDSHSCITNNKAITNLPEQKKGGGELWWKIIQTHGLCVSATVLYQLSY